jgi:hypothetical protein
MKKRTVSIVFILSCFLASFSLSAQVLDSTLAVYGTKYQQERTYLHYDKAAYVPGETIWFKAYIMEGLFAAEGSKTLYVDWVDEKGGLLYHTSSPIVDGGVTNGQFDVPATYKGHFIHVRAYTKWMLNFDTAFIYKKNIRVIQKGGLPSALPTATASLQFFPEGGDMISGIRNKVAFKAQDQWGKPVAIKGVVQKNGTTVDSLQVVHDGMGFFYLIPEAGAKYTAKWKDTKNVEHTTTLPEAKKDGISLQISFTAGKRIFTLNRSPDAGEQLKTLHLIGTMQQNLALKANVSLKDNLTNSGILPVENLPSGVLTITVFDGQWNAVAERVIHVNNTEYFFRVQSTVQKYGLSKRGRNEIEVTVPQGIEANLSISVTDGSIESDSSDHIVSRFLLTSELRGSIYNPSYYFKNNSDSLAQKLDLVMLTNGWRRFKWEDVTKGKFPVITYPKDTTYLALSGKLFGATPAQFQSGGTMMMMVKEKDSAAQMVLAPIERDGSFRNPEFIFFDSLTVYYQPPKNLSSTTANFMTARMAALNYNYKDFAGKLPFPDTTGYFRHALLAQEAVEIEEKWKGKVLETVTVTARTKSPVQVLDEKYAKGLFTSSNAYQFDVLNDKFALGSINIFNYLQGKVPGLQITGGQTAGGSPGLSWRGGAPIIYLDEMPADPQMISGIAVQDVAYIKVFRPPFMGTRGSVGDPSNGAIAIYTRRGGDVAREPGKGLASNVIVGYSPVREFSSPNYASFVRDNEKRDVRTTLLWKPNAATQKNKNKIPLIFYNTDVFSKSLRLVIEGMTKDGQLTHYEELIE